MAQLALCQAERKTPRADTVSDMQINGMRSVRQSPPKMVNSTRTGVIRSDSDCKPSAPRNADGQRAEQDGKKQWQPQAELRKQCRRQRRGQPQ